MGISSALSVSRRLVVAAAILSVAPLAQAETWAVPLKGGARGSAWCVCRSIGTSPHIGQDWTKSGAKEAVAIQTGRIMELDFSSTCGYLATFVDAHNTRWRYVHLNRPGVATDTRVTRGNTLATISAYPTSSCGTGPHLHLERRSAGYWGDSPSGKSCDAGFETCYYNPNSPFTGRSADAQAADAADLISYADAPRYDVAERGPDARCQRDPALYPSEALRLPQADAKLALSIQLSQRSPGKPALIQGQASLDGNAANDCRAGECLVDWTLYAQTASGRFARVFHDSAVRGIALQRVSEERFCAPADTTGFVVRATGLSGQTYWQVAQAD